MDNDLKWYFDNYDKLTRSDLRTFVQLIGSMVAKRLNINTKITYYFDKLEKYGGGCSACYNHDKNGRYILPLSTDEMLITLDTNLEVRYIKSKDDSIKFSNETEIPERLNVLLLLTQVASHEIRHAYQYEQLMNNNIDNPESLLWLKEVLVRDYLYQSNNDKFYTDNYYNVFTEQDAYIYGRNFFIEMLNRYLKFDSDTKKLYVEFEEQKGNFPYREKNMFAQFKDLNDETLFKIGTSYIIELFNEIVKTLSPEFIKNSMLKYEYNLDGTKKTYMELMKDKEEHKKNGEDLDYLYDFIIKCDYNLQIQMYSYELNSKDISSTDKKDIINNLNSIYEKFLLNYEVVHLLYSKKIQEIESKLKSLALDTNMPLLDKAKLENELHKELVMYMNIEQQLLSNVEKFKMDQQIFKTQQELYFANLSLIDEYKKDKGIIDIIENGVVVDKHNYSDEINYLNRQLSFPFKNIKYLYLRYVRNAINNVHFNKNNEELFEEDLELVNLFLSKSDKLNDDQINKLNVIKKIIESNINLKKIGNKELDKTTIQK